MFGKLILDSEKILILDSQTLLLIIVLSLLLFLLLLRATLPLFINYLESTFGNSELILDLIYLAFISLSGLFGRLILNSQTLMILNSQKLLSIIVLSLSLL